MSTSGPVACAVLAQQRQARGGIADGADQPERSPGLAAGPVGNALAGAADRRQSEHARRSVRQGDRVAADQRQAVAFARCLDAAEEIASPIRPARRCVSDSSAPAGVAPFAARSDRFTATSFQPTLAGGSAVRKCTPSAMLSWVTTRPSRTATSSSSPRASGAVAMRRSRSMTLATSRIASRPSRAARRFLRDGVEQAVDEAALALVVEGVRDIDIFGDDRADRHVGAGDQLIGAGAKDRAHRPVEPLEASSLRPGGR